MPTFWTWVRVRFYRRCSPVYARLRGVALGRVARCIGAFFKGLILAQLPLL